jgi:hypothetical protein
MAEYDLSTSFSSIRGLKPLFAVYLAVSGGRVLLPDAVSVAAPPDDNSLVQFLDARGAVIAVFRRMDVAYYSDRPDEIEKLVREQEQTEGQRDEAPATEPQI